MFDQSTGTITGYKGTAANVEIPAQINGHDVVALSDAANGFKNNTAITSVTFAEGSKVTTIGGRVFQGCTSLVSVELPGTLEGPLGASAFNGCTALGSINIPSGVTKLNDYCFSGCSGLTSATLPTTLTVLGNFAFMNCSSLESVTLPSSLTTYGLQSAVFAGCTSLASVDLSSTAISTVPARTFKNCTSLQEVKLPNTVTAVRDNAFEGCTGLASISLPDSVTEIDKSVFTGCTALTELTLPSSVATISGTAFSGSSLTEITIDKSYDAEMGSPWAATSAQVIWSNTLGQSGSYLYNPVTLESGNTGYVISKFIGGSGVTSVDFDGDNVSPVVAIEDYAFYKAPSLTSVSLPQGITSIGDSAFYGCKNLTEATLPEGLTTLGASAFYGCKNLTEATLPEGLTTLGASAFFGCSKLAEVSIPGSLSEIPQKAFQKCSLSKGVTIASGVTTIGANAFSNCGYLGEITIPQTVESIAGNAFSACSALTKISIPEKEKDSITGAPWCDGSAKTPTVLWKGTGQIEGKYVYEVDSATSGITITKYLGTEASVDIASDFRTANVTGAIVKIDKNAFSATSVTSVALPSTVTEIGSSAFYNCKSLTKLECPESLKGIGASAFSGCESLEEAAFNDSLESVGESAFLGCTKLASVEIPDSVKSLGNSVFKKCEGLTSVKLGGGITEIPQSAFAGCTSLQSAGIPENVTAIGAYAFNGCTALESVKIPSRVTKISDYTFNGCTGLKSVDLSKSLTSIGENSFKNTALEGVLELPVTTTTVKKNAFSEVTTLAELKIPYAKAKFSGFANHPYGLDTSKTTITYTGGTPVITPTVTKQADGTYQATFKVSFGGGAYKTDAINKLWIPNPDNPTQQIEVNIGGTATEWDSATSTPQYVYTINQRAAYTFKVEGLDSTTSTETVVIGDPDIELGEVSLYSGDMANLTEHQLFFALGLIDEDGAFLVKDEFGGDLVNGKAQISKEDLTTLIRLESGKDASVTIKIVDDLASYEYEVKVKAVSQSFSGCVTWDDNNDAAGLRPESVEVSLLSAASDAATTDGEAASTATVVDTATVTAGADGSWSYAFNEVSPWPETAGTAKVGAFHCPTGTQLSFSVSAQDVEGYTVRRTDDGSDASKADFAYTLNGVEVTFNLSGGTLNDTSAATTVTVAPGETAVVPAVSKLMHTLMGWKSSNAAYADLAADATVTPAAISGQAVTYTAQWATNAPMSVPFDLEIALSTGDFVNGPLEVSAGDTVRFNSSMNFSGMKRYVAAFGGANGFISGSFVLTMSDPSGILKAQEFTSGDIRDYFTGGIAELLEMTGKPEYDATTNTYTFSFKVQDTYGTQGISATKLGALLSATANSTYSATVGDGIETADYARVVGTFSGTLNVRNAAGSVNVLLALSGTQDAPDTKADPTLGTYNENPAAGTVSVTVVPKQPDSGTDPDPDNPDNGDGGDEGDGGGNGGDSGDGDGDGGDAPGGPDDGGDEGDGGDNGGEGGDTPGGEGGDPDPDPDPDNPGGNNGDEGDGGDEGGDPDDGGDVPGGDEGGDPDPDNPGGDPDPDNPDNGDGGDEGGDSGDGGNGGDSGDGDGGNSPDAGDTPGDGDGDEGDSPEPGNPGAGDADGSDEGNGDAGNEGDGSQAPGTSGSGEPTDNADEPKNLTMAATGDKFNLFWLGALLAGGLAGLFLALFAWKKCKEHSDVL